MNTLARRFYRWEYFWLVLVVLASLALHFSLINHPADIILDEKHYINDARSIIENHETLRIEHPPLGKLLIVVGMKIFGDNLWGWRVLPIFFGTGMLVLFYLLCRKLGMTRTAASIAVFLLGFENLNFLISGLAMLDVFYVSLMVGGFLLYVNRKYIAAGASIGLSTLAKLSGFFGGLTVVIDWIYSYKQARDRRFIYTVISAVVIFFALMVLFDFIIVREASSFLNPVKRIIDMLGLTGGLTFNYVDHPSESPPWEWLYTYQAMPFYYAPHWTAAISFSVWAFILPTFAYLIYRAVKRDEGGIFGLAWFSCTYLIWIPVTLVTQRVTYVYYFYPAVGAICLGMGMGLSQLIEIFKNRTAGRTKWLALAAVIIILAAHVVSFLLLSPLFPFDFLKFVGITGT